jgi:hypothetical protein
MSTTTITIIIFTVIFLSIGAMYLSQARERARIEKIRRTNICNERYQRMQLLLHDLPPQYLNNELRIMIAERSAETLKELLRINPNPRHEGYLKSDQDYIKRLRENDPKFPKVAINSEAKAKEVRDNLEALHRFIESQHKNKRLPAVNAKKYLDYISFSICQSKADLFCNRAEAAKAKPRVAIHNYHSAIDAFKGLANHPQAVKAIQQFKAKIKALEAEADHVNKAVKEKNPTDTTGQNNEWNSFMEKKDTWQKKNNYDD